MRSSRQTVRAIRERVRLGDNPMAYLSSVPQGIFPALQNRSVLSEELAEKAKWLIKLRWKW